MLPLLPEQAELERSFEEDLATALGAIDFAEELPENATPEQLDKIAVPMLRFLIQSGAEGGYKDSVSAITDGNGEAPSEANNWLFDEDEEAYIGRFVDEREEGDRTFSFRIERSGDGWTRSIRAISGVGGDD